MCLKCCICSCHIKVSTCLSSHMRFISCHIMLLVIDSLQDRYMCNTCTHAHTHKHTHTNFPEQKQFQEALTCIWFKKLHWPPLYSSWYLFNFFIFFQCSYVFRSTDTAALNHQHYSACLLLVTFMLWLPCPKKTNSLVWLLWQYMSGLCFLVIKA